MKKKKIGLLIIFMMILSGCSVKSNITINQDLSVIEEVDMSGTKEFFNNRYKMLPIHIIEDILTSDDREEILKQNNYSYRINEQGDYPSVIARREYSNIDNFVNDTIFKKQYFNSFKTKTEDNIISIDATDYIKYEQGDLERYPISTFTLNVTLPYTVTKSNADRHIKSTNTYVWYINDKTENKEIHLSFDKTKIYIYNLPYYIGLGILLIIIIIVIYFILKIKNRNRKNNQI